MLVVCSKVLAITFLWWASPPQLHIFTPICFAVMYKFDSLKETNLFNLSKAKYISQELSKMDIGLDFELTSSLHKAPSGFVPGCPKNKFERIK